MVCIPGLPDNLKHLPPPRVSPDDEREAEKRDLWDAWTLEMRRYRLQRRIELERDPALIPFELRKCAEHPAYFIAMWGFIFEPRGNGRGGDSPFLPYPFQVELLDTFLATLDADGEAADLVVSKSRDMGASWTMVAFALWGWLFRYPWQVRLISRKEGLVDAKSPDSLFWKIDFLFKLLPAWMIPAGYDPKFHRMKLYFENPSNGNVIAGESTTADSARGGRATWIGYDEAAMIDDFGDTWAAGANSTDHRLAISSESLDHGPDFYHLRKGIGMDYQPTVVGIDWWQHPYHDASWYETMKRRFAAEPGKFQREVLRDAHAGSTTLVYPKAEDCYPDDAIRFVQGMPLFVTMDPGFNDDTAIIWLQENTTNGKIDILNAYQNARLPADFYGTILTGEAKSGDWMYAPEDLQLMSWTKNLPAATYYGDVYGNNTLGATLDSFYSRLRNFGIFVNVDRMPDGQLTAYRMECRTHKGRREALRELIPRLRFADNPGAKLVLRALQENRFAPDDKARTSEPTKPLHDWTSHLVSALEYFAVNYRMRRQVLSRELSKPKKATFAPMASTSGPRWSTTDHYVRR